MSPPLHYGSDIERADILERIHRKFADALSEAGIYIPLPELKNVWH